MAVGEGGARDKRLHGRATEDAVRTMLYLAAVP